MKKSLLALAVAALAVSSAASAATIYDKDGVSVDVYGRVQAVYYSQDSGSNAQSAANDGNLNASSRLGFNFRSELTSWADAFANVEWENANDDSSPDFNSRYLWVGVDFGQFGAVKFGKFEDAVKYVIATTDIFDDWGCNGQLGNDDRRDGMFAYNWSGYGVDVNLTFGTAKDDQHVDGAFYSTYEGLWTGDTGANGLIDPDTASLITNNTSDGNEVGGREKLDIEYSYAVSVGYTSPAVLFGPISVKAGFGGAQFQDQDAAEGDIFGYQGNIYDSYTQWAVSASWGTLGDGLFLGLMAQARDFDLYDSIPAILDGSWGNLRVSDYLGDYTVSGVEAVVSYGFANGVSLTTGWEWMNIDMDGAGKPDVDAYTIPVYVNYQVNPNFRVWAEARFDAGTDDSNSNPLDNFDEVSEGAYGLTENVYSIGARYTF